MVQTWLCFRIVEAIVEEGEVGLYWKFAVSVCVSVTCPQMQ